VLSCYFASYELARNFMNSDVQFGVSDLCVVWNGWSDILCWMSIKFEWKLKLKGQQSFCYE
jgi:hypothetical protein